MTIYTSLKPKLFTVLLTVGAVSASLAGCTTTPPLLGGSEFNLQGLMVTKILPDRTAVSSSLKWNTVAGASHYELYRKQDGGSEVSLGETKIPVATLSFNDLNLKQDSTYEYIIHAISSNNKVISTGNTQALKPITSEDLQAATITGLNPPPAVNVVSRITNLTWSSVEGSDLYYASVTNDQTGKQVFGMFTNETTINMNAETSPVKPPELIQQELPILNGGLEASVKHSFKVYTIKFNNSDTTKATAIGLRESEKVNLITG